MNTDQLFLGIDIGGSSIKYGVGNRKQGLQSFQSLPVTQKDLSGLEGLIVQIISEMQISSVWNGIKAIGIGTPGLIDRKTGQLVGINPNLPFWIDIRPESIVPPDLSIPVFSDNDANLMALAESTQYPLDACVLGITIGSGIGSGYVVASRIYHGSNGFAMELGHVCVAPGGALCNCGRQGCLEAYAAEKGMRNRLQERGKDLSRIQLAELLSLAKTDTVVQDVVDTGISYMALAVGNAIMLLDPDVVVFGGGGSEIADYPLKELIKMIRSYLPEPVNHRIKLEKAHMGNKSGVLGAILHAESLFADTWER
ncbi:MAG: hypothetical protein CVU48_08125 [Candidatus Cloacimonetes bacterium HGW-Cloacimonetes-1]|jgi:glucokinase|nr:MAG: hypothetical protein CVU48_08125 [Candidatus Cloacimonetes bacterium HGW-Cloacimonetes-1]